MTGCYGCGAAIADATADEVLVSPAGIYCSSCWKAAYLGDGWIENPTREPDDMDEPEQQSFGFL